MAKRKAVKLSEAKTIGQAHGPRRVNLMDPTNEVFCTFYLDAGVAAALKRAANETGKSEGRIVTDALEWLVKNPDKGNRPELRLIDGYRCANRSNGGGVYLDDENNVYVTEDDSKPKRTTIRAALEFMARRHSDGPESFTDGDPIGMDEWFRLLASKLPEGV